MCIHTYTGTLKSAQFFSFVLHKQGALFGHAAAALFADSAEFRWKQVSMPAFVVARHRGCWALWAEVNFKHNLPSDLFKVSSLWDKLAKPYTILSP